MGAKRFAKDGRTSFSGLQSFFTLSDEEKALYANEISRENTRRAFYLSLIALPVSIVHILLFSPRLETVTGIDYKWVSSIIYSHLSLFILAVISSIYLYLSIFRWKKNGPASRIYTYVLFFLILVVGTVITAFDQYVTPAITPFLNTTLIIGLFFQIRPAFSIFYYTASYIIYDIAISQTQLNQEILISNQVNGLSITAIALGLSIILWRSKLTRLLQREQIIKQNQALFESNAQKDKFFSIIAHDLANPITSIIGFSDLLRERVQEKKYEAVGHYAEIINQSVSSTHELLRNLMEWSRAHTGRMDFKPEPVDLNGLVKEAEQLFAGALLQKKISLTVHIPENTVVYADMHMISTILRNLISNAIKFTHVNGQIMLSVLKNPHEYLITVSDNGVGISKASLDMLFRIDQNKSTRGTQNESGTGLGLILCKELTEKHGGAIWVESEPGKGSTFTFSIPSISQPKEI